LEKETGPLGTIAEHEALAAEDARYLAQRSGDIDGMETLFGDDLVYQHSTGVLDDKAGFIRAISSGEVRYRRMERHDVKVRIYGGIAIITGRARFEVTVNGADSTVRLRFHSIWAKRGAGPQFVSWQATLLPQ
jgi:hypothetical protein